MAQILIIDDDDLVRTMLRLTLDHFGHNIVEAHNGKEGLRLFREVAPDIVITDMVMPDIAGMAVLKELSQATPRVKVIAISGGGRAGNEDHLKIAVQMGASFVLAKPFSTQVLMNAVNSLLSADFEKSKENGNQVHDKR